MAYRYGKAIVRSAALALSALCTGCSTAGFWLIHPAGPVAAAGLQSWIVDTGATFLVIGPATLLVMWAIWRYHRRIGKGAYVPGWNHSVGLEATFWGVPQLVVIGLGFYSTYGAFQTEPTHPGAMAVGNNPDARVPAVEIDVITTDWQWLFIYPELHIALANELVIPVHTPIRFRLTSATVATDFFIPQLAGQIDVMPGMRTWQGLIANNVGSYQGFASDYNGPGFSWMRFETKVVSADDYKIWAKAMADAPAHLDEAGFLKFAAPTINTKNTVLRFSSVQNNLFDNVVYNVMMGRIYETPSGMTEKKSHDVDGGRQPTQGAAPSEQDHMR
ncbi:ubiquinol oxidase subunit II [Lichenicola cladoniae]|uniref:Ubiquinol oxidase subunit II n=1 Tax=Lichenicola cladoniae TaxID=1484109 RepID=A0A6M8HR49_9PROT|nr:ubiquinol oxidase subunit II [Lichenicola cladoniae]NPD68826.1 ubiquinol oxidase subunit II [Acetobacteraceae bacterium]QKE90755.1 ubiquinol oxidase subunit II [Lichenicola cladoniae]